MAVQNFLVFPQGGKHPSIVGRPTVDAYFMMKYPKATIVEVDEFSLGIKASATVSDAGTVAGKLAFDRLVVARPVDKASVSLLPIVGAGMHFPWFQLYIRKAGSEQPSAPYLGYEFQEAVIVDVDWVAGADDYAAEKLTFAFAAAVVGFREQKSADTLAETVKKGWSVVSNSATVVDNDLLA